MDAVVSSALMIRVSLQSISRSRLPVPRMPEEISTFLSFEGAGNQADSATKSFDCAHGGLAQLRFHFAEALFDRIEIRRILRQISQARAHRFDCLAHANDLVSRKIVCNAHLDDHGSCD